MTGVRDHHGAVVEDTWREFSAQLRSFIARRVSNPEDVDDLLQTVFLRMTSSGGALEGRERLLAWLYTVTRNAITDFYRAAPNRRELASDVLQDSPVFDADDETAVSEARRELARCLRPMLSALPPEQAQAVQLVDLEGVPQVEAARRLQISVSGTKSRVQRGRAKLRQELIRCCEVSIDVRGDVHDFTPRGDGCAGACDCGGGD